MNLRNLADDQLLVSADQAAKREREAITVVLHHLREIEARRLFAKLKYTSLFDYAVKRLKYSHDQAAQLTLCRSITFNREPSVAPMSKAICACSAALAISARPLRSWV